MIETQEKKVEYLELIYDLIFVYLIGRNNSILQYLENGWIPGEVFLAYVLCSLSVIQIWNFSTFYMNLYGRNSIRDHVFLFINMYLLYHMADGISSGLQSSYYQFCVSWALILFNIGLQHLIELHNHSKESWIIVKLKRKALILIGEAGLIILNMAVYRFSGISIMYIPILFGIILTALSRNADTLVAVDFMHLSERAMLYVVFTFGEMIISITSYFAGAVTINSLYFSLMAFLIVAGLFLSYEILYNRLIDREMTTNGTGYMMLHVFLVFALNNISVALKFMRMEEVELLPKILFITGSFLVYFIILFMLGIFTKKRRLFNRRFFAAASGLGISFLILMFLFRAEMNVNILISVTYVFLVFAVLYWFAKKDEAV